MICESAAVFYLHNMQIDKKHGNLLCMSYHCPCQPFITFNICMSDINPFIRGGGALRARITFTAHFDPLGVKIARRYFWTFPKHAQIRH